MCVEIEGLLGSCGNPKDNIRLHVLDFADGHGFWNVTLGDVLCSSVYGRYCFLVILR